MNIRDFLIIALHNWRVFSLTILISVSIAFSISFLITPLWETETMIRIGNIGGKPIESPSELISRIRSSSNVKAVLLRSNIEITQKNISTLRSNTRLITNGAETIEIRVRSGSAQDAKKIMESYFYEIEKQHEQMSAIELNAIKDEFKRIKKFNDHIAKLLISNKENKLTTLSYLNDLSKAQILFQSEEKLSILTQKLLPPMTVATQLRSSIDGMPEPVTPNRVLIAILGALVGLAIALVYTFSSKQ